MKSRRNGNGFADVRCHCWPVFQQRGSSVGNSDCFIVGSLVSTSRTYSQGSMEKHGLKSIPAHKAERLSERLGKAGKVFPAPEGTPALISDYQRSDDHQSTIRVVPAL